MSAIESRAKLVQAAKKLAGEWYHTKEVWRDENCRQFDKQFMTPLETHIRGAVMAMERIGTLVDSARKDCADTTGPGR
jgi:hypothetical protein